MGDKILMKTLFSISLISLLYAHITFANELSWVDEQIEAIKPSRVGVSLQDIAKLHDPFVFLHKKSEKKKMQSSPSATISTPKPIKTAQKVNNGLSLEAILNKSALINGKWYKIGDSLYGYTITKIDIKSVALIKNKKTTILSTQSKKTNLKFSK